MTTNKFSLVAEATLDGRLFLARALAHGDTLSRIPPEQVDTLYQNIAAIAHKLITMKTADLSDESALRTHIQTAFTLTSLGLEYGSKGDLDKAVQLLHKTRVVKFFQIGNTLMERLHDRARHLLEHAVIRPPQKRRGEPARHRLHRYRNRRHPNLHASRTRIPKGVTNISDHHTDITGNNQRYRYPAPAPSPQRSRDD